MKNMGSIYLVVALYLCGQATAQSASVPAPRTDPTFIPPSWLKKPTFDDTMAVFPHAAAEKRQSGKAAITCVVKTDGSLVSCVVTKEEPAGEGFGDAALVLAPTLLMNPAMKDGHPVQSDVTVPFNFPFSQSLIGKNVQRATVLNSTIWSKTPSTADILSALEKKVGDRFAEGKVVLQCDISKRTGRLEQCILANASPGMTQFEGVARSLIPKFAADPEALQDIKDDVKINLAFSFPNMSSVAWTKRLLTKPIWVRTIDPGLSQKLYPAEAVRAGLSNGLAMVDCLVAADGALTQCKAVSESVPAVGFGGAAEQIAQAFAANPWTEDGLPADGSHILMPIRMIDSEATTSPNLSKH